MVACDVIVAQLSVARLGQLTVLSQLVTHDVVEQQRALLCVVVITLVQDLTTETRNPSRRCEAGRRSRC
jgi:hypothetical protein